MSQGQGQGQDLWAGEVVIQEAVGDEERKAQEQEQKQDEDEEKGQLQEPLQEPQEPPQQGLIKAWVEKHFDMATTGVSDLFQGGHEKNLGRFLKGFLFVVVGLVKGVFTSVTSFFLTVATYLLNYMKNILSGRWNAALAAKEASGILAMLSHILLMGPEVIAKTFGLVYGSVSGLGLLRETIESIRSGEAFGVYAKTYVARLWVYIRTAGREWDVLAIPRFFTPLSRLFTSQQEPCRLPGKVNDYSKMWDLLKKSEFWNNALVHGDLSYLDNFDIETLGAPIPLWKVSYIGYGGYGKLTGTMDQEEKREAFTAFRTYLARLVSMDEFNSGESQASESSVRKVLLLVNSYMDNLSQGPTTQIKLICSEYDTNSRKYSLAYQGVSIPLAWKTWGMTHWGKNRIQVEYDTFLADVNVHLQSVLDCKGAIEVCQNDRSKKNVCDEARRWYDNVPNKVPKDVELPYNPISYYTEKLQKLKEDLEAFAKNPLTNPSSVTSNYVSTARDKLESIKLSNDYETLINDLQRDLPKFNKANPQLTTAAAARVVSANELRASVFDTIYKIKEQYVSFKKRMGVINARMVGKEKVFVVMINRIASHLMHVDEQLVEIGEQEQKLNSELNPTYANVLTLTETLKTLKNQWGEKLEALTLDTPGFDRDLNTTADNIERDFYLLESKDKDLHSISQRITTKSKEMHNQIEKDYERFYKIYEPLRLGLEGVVDDESLKKEMGNFIEKWNSLGGNARSKGSDPTLSPVYGSRVQEAINDLKKVNVVSNILAEPITNNESLITKGCNAALKATQTHYSTVVGENWNQRDYPGAIEQGLKNLKATLGPSHYLVLQLESCYVGPTIIGLNASVRDLYSNESPPTIDSLLKTEKDLNQLNQTQITGLLAELSQAYTEGRILFIRYEKNRNQFVNRFDTFKKEQQIEFDEWSKDLKTALSNVDEKMKPLSGVLEATSYEELAQRRDDLMGKVQNFILPLKPYVWEEAKTLTPQQLKSFSETFEKDTLIKLQQERLDLIKEIGELLGDIEKKGEPSASLGTWIKGVWGSAMGFEAARQVERTLMSTGKFVNGEPLSTLTEAQKEEYMGQISQAKWDARYRTMMWGAGVVGMGVIIGYLWKKIKDRRKRKLARPRTMWLVVQGVDSKGGPISYARDDYLETINIISEKFGLDITSTPRISPNRSQMIVKWIMSEDFLYEVHQDMLKYMVKKNLTTRALAQKYLDRTYDKLKDRREGRTASRWDTIYLPLYLSDVMEEERPSPSPPSRQRSSPSPPSRRRSSPSPPSRRRSSSRKY